MEKAMNGEIVGVEVDKNELGGYNVRIRLKNDTSYNIGRFYDPRGFPNPLELMGTSKTFAMEWMVRALNKTTR